jgi:hypothetical protein
MHGKRLPSLGVELLVELVEKSKNVHGRPRGVDSTAQGSDPYIRVS